MPSIKSQKYIVKPSDSREWIIIQSNSGLAVDTELRMLDYHYDCQPKQIEVNGEKIYCSQLCCYAGCYVSEDEIKSVEAILPKIKPLLKKDSLELLEKVKDQIFVLEDYDKDEKLYKTRTAPEEWEFSDNDEEKEEVGEKDIKEENESESLEIEEENYEDEEEEKEIPKNHCLFLTDKGLCALHQYYNDNGINWVKEKFNICVTFPLDIRPQDKTLAFMDEFDSFTYFNVDCISKDEDKKIELGMPQIIDSMKYAIVHRFSLEWWEALSAFSKDYRAGKIDLDFIYKEMD
ncbi:hypothetical protein DSAG12_00030 [Promethearchaeum syntrophicum]|uniref:Uncharacterized protein n=1 Tax=Promethearchaeum syntrophicum TaxID=2594042 RepID=A0A5B9D547_9ARCH|nr:hypothetical protein [Candidatus Prometheoarchaeum syntrophicum]QEE14219.1 hypothetical protein DSAG12_00030 [Candidatus Prometheoarchaeum syntrophicum]